MGLVDKIKRSGDAGQAAESTARPVISELGNGAIDTLGCVIRAMGNLSFPLDDEANDELFQALCDQFACHVENGTAVPSHGIPQTRDGERQWSGVRRFYIDRRTSEQAYVTERIGDYRDIVQDLVDGLRHIGQRDQDTETGIFRNLGAVEAAVNSGNLQEIKDAVSQTIDNVTDIFVKQKSEYELQIRELNDRMSCLRDDLVQAQEKMQRDSLTYAYNRGAFDTAITRALNMHFILSQPVTLVMIDLDDFKGINDTHGHAAGDEVLRQVGESLARSFIRKSDFVARYGGDEFAVILTDTSAKNSLPLIERFMQRIQQIAIPGADADTTVGCSIGYTECHASDSVATLIKRADKGLYDAKHAGRNCHRFVPPAPADD